MWNNEDLMVIRLGCDWIVCETIGQGIDYYLWETGLTLYELTDDRMEECDIDDSGMWWCINEFPESVECQDDEECIFNGIRYRYFCGEPSKHINFKEAIELTNDKPPYIIASTEY